MGLANTTEIVNMACGWASKCEVLRRCNGSPVRDFIVLLLTNRWQHFVATKIGWGGYPLGNMQNPKTC